LRVTVRVRARARARARASRKRRTLTCDSRHAEYIAVRSPLALRSCDERRSMASG